MCGFLLIFENMVLSTSDALRISLRVEDNAYDYGLFQFWVNDHVKMF
jgi:hypothetical protein